MLKDGRSGVRAVRQVLRFPRGQGAGADVEKAEATNTQTPDEKRCSCVEAEMRFSRHKRVVPKARIQLRIGNDKHLIRLDGVLAEGEFDRRWFRIDSDGCFEVLVRFPHERQERDGDLVRHGGDFRDRVEGDAVVLLLAKAICDVAAYQLSGCGRVRVS